MPSSYYSYLNPRDKFNFDGSLWIIYMFLYSIGRFILQFMRMDDVKFTILGLDIQEAHIVTFALFIISTILLFYTLDLEIMLKKIPLKTKP